MIMDSKTLFAMLVAISFIQEMRCDEEHGAGVFASLGDVMGFEIEDQHNLLTGNDKIQDDAEEVGDMELIKILPGMKKDENNDQVQLSANVGVISEVDEAEEVDDEIVDFILPRNKNRPMSIRWWRENTHGKR